MKRVFTFFCALCLLVSCFTVMPMKVEAASNPYPSSQDADGDGFSEIPCTRYAWQQAYDRLGIALPAWGNAINWYNNARNAGYSVGTTPQANSIAVWSIDTHSWGHVGFVTAVNGSQMTVNEGGRTDKEGNSGIVNGQVLPSSVNSYWYGRTLVGFIYLSSSPSVTLSWSGCPEKHSIGTTNAVLAGWCTMNVDNSAVSQVGIYLYDYSGKQLKSKSEKFSFSGQPKFSLWYDVNGELGYTLASGTPYKYKFMAVVSGKTYYSPVYSFTTGGPHTHTYNSGTVTKQPTCTSSGTRTYTCTTCGGTKTGSISAKGHNYASATCTSPKKCKTCGVTSGSAKGHSYVAATCSSPKKCKVCGATSGSALGHKYGSWRTVVAATCTSGGMRQRVCTTCNNAVTQQGIAPTGHSYKNSKCSACGKADPNAKVAKITTQPKNVATTKGKTAKVSVKATGDGLKYTWYYANKGASKWKKSSVTKATYSVKMTSSLNGRRVYCVVKDKYGNTVKSNVVTLTMKQTAKIKTQPKKTAVYAGSTAKFSIKASGDGLKYTWYYAKKGVKKYTKASDTDSVFEVKTSSSLNGCKVYCVVKDKYGNSVKSKVVTLTVKNKAKVTTQPKSVTVAKNKTVKVTVKATGDGLKYQWYYAKKGSSSYKKISGATKSSYSVKMTSSVNGRKVYCKVTDKYGNSVKSNVVTLSMSNDLGKVVGYWDCIYGIEKDGRVETIYEGAYSLSFDANGTGYIFVPFSEPEMEFYFRVEFVKKSSNKYYYRLKETKNNGFYLDDDGVMDVVYDSSADRIEIKFDDGFKVYFKRYNW